MLKMSIHFLLYLSYPDGKQKEINYITKYDLHFLVLSTREFI